MYFPNIQIHLLRAFYLRMSANSSLALFTLPPLFFHSSLLRLYNDKLILPAIILPCSELDHAASLYASSSMIDNLFFKFAAFHIASNDLEPYLVEANSW
jgi:hypothetical protein